MLIHLTVCIAKHYVKELNRSTLSNQHQEESHLNKSNSLKLKPLVNIAEWKDTLESIDMKQFTLNRFKTNEKGKTSKYKKKKTK